MATSWPKQTFLVFVVQVAEQFTFFAVQCKSSFKNFCWLWKNLLLFCDSYPDLKGDISELSDGLGKKPGHFNFFKQDVFDL
jgi:hypothetical protein